LTLHLEVKNMQLKKQCQLDMCALDNSPNTGAKMLGSKYFLKTTSMHQPKVGTGTSILLFAYVGSYLPFSIPSLQIFNTYKGTTIVKGTKIALFKWTTTILKSTTIVWKKRQLFLSNEKQWYSKEQQSRERNDSCSFQMNNNYTQRNNNRYIGLN